MSKSQIVLESVVNLSHCCASMTSSRTRSSYNLVVNQPDVHSHTPIAGWERRQCPSFLYENDFTFLFKTSMQFLDAFFVFYWFLVAISMVEMTRVSHKRIEMI